MSAVALPKGWQNWPEAQLSELLSGLTQLAQEREQGKVPWRCKVAGCDGKPHKGRRGPHARAEQLPPDNDDWDNWVLLAGRGYGKTRTGAEWALEQAKEHARGALVGPTAGDARDILVEGESGIMACAPAAFRPVYEPSKRRLTYPNGALQTVYSADEPDRLRGPQHHYAWADELAAWKRLQYAWDMLQMGMRLGDHPRVCITTTPRPLPLIKELNKHERSAVVRGSTYDNLHNLAPTFRRTVLDRYAGTTLGRQELDAEILEDLPGALVARRHIDAARVDAAPELDLIIVAIDPAGTGTGDEAGIVVVGRGAPVYRNNVAGPNGELPVASPQDVYVLADYSGQMTAQQTGDKAWAALEEHGAAYLVYEDNFGKQWLRDGLVDAYLRRGGVKEEAARLLRKVTAQHGKKLRAQPVAMRYEQGRVHHVQSHPELEDQLTTWNPDEDTDSPDRVDALVHGVTDLLKREKNMVSVGNPHAMGLGRASSEHPLIAMRRRSA